jgi:nitrite reductase (NADH) small subunit
MAWQLAFAAEELPGGGRKFPQVGKRQIGVFRHHGKLYVALNFCPHAGAPICQGDIDHPIFTEGPGGENRRDFDKPTIRCPWHHWEFDLQTGHSLPHFPAHQNLRGSRGRGRDLDRRLASGGLSCRFENPADR